MARIKGNKNGQRRTAKPKEVEKHKELVFSDKPNCPRCDIRNYKVLDVDNYKEGQQKFTAQCNECGVEFKYVKAI